MTRDVQITREHGVETRTEVTPPGWCDVVSFYPNTTPWDYRGGKHQREMMTVLRNAGIESIGLITHERRTSPHGSGPGGRVRFGDDMLPGCYRVAVRDGDKIRAIRALDAHRQAIRDWLNGRSAMPEACR